MKIRFWVYAACISFCLAVITNLYDESRDFNKTLSYYPCSVCGKCYVNFPIIIDHKIEGGHAKTFRICTDCTQRARDETKGRENKSNSFFYWIDIDLDDN